MPLAEFAARPFLKWAGGKAQLLDQFSPHFPRHWKTFYEPFLGGGAVFFRLAQTYPERRYVLSDLNPELINAYVCVRDQVEDLIALLQEHQARHGRDYYYALRASKPTDPVQRAARLIYLNKTCFNGLYRENSRGEFNVPLGRYKNPTICDASGLRAASRVLQGVELHVRPFEWVVEQAEAGDFVYFDPPYYPVSATSNFTGYNGCGFGEADQVRLRDVFVSLAGRGVQVLLSNSDCEFVRQLYRDFVIYSVAAKRCINSRAERRGAVGEVLVAGVCGIHPKPIGLDHA